MINWPDSLVDELASRRCVIFIGSGASASAKKQIGETEISPLLGQVYLKYYWKNLQKMLSDRSKMQPYFLKIKIILIVQK